MGKLSRLATLGGLTTRVTGSYLADKVRDAFRSTEDRKEAKDALHIQNAKEIAENLSKLKGAAMKLGQQIAVAASSLDLPEEVGAVLGKLHAQAEPIPFKVIKEEVEAQIERPLAEVFSFFDEKPLGTASLAQAHVARLLDGREVVVKILHRGVEDSVDTDLMALKTLLVSGRVLQRKREEVDAAFDEIRERLKEELDYLQEAVNIQFFTEHFGNDPRVRIARLHPELCTERMLTMDRLPGVPLETFAKIASPEARQRAGETLTELYYTQVFDLLTLHADPHPGNYLFELDGRVGILDFGCVKRFDPWWVSHYAKAALAALDGKKDECLVECAALGAWDGKDQVAGDILWRFIDVLATGFRPGVITLGDDREQLMEMMKPVIKELVKNPNVTVPKDILFLHRSLGGMYSMGRRLKITKDFGKVVRDHAAVAIARVGSD